MWPKKKGIGTKILRKSDNLNQSFGPMLLNAPPKRNPCQVHLGQFGFSTLMLEIFPTAIFGKRGPTEEHLEKNPIKINPKKQKRKHK